LGRRTSRGRRGDRSSRKTGSGCRPLSSTGSSSPPWDWRARRSAEDSVAGGPSGVRGDSSRSCAGTASAGSSGSSSDLSSGDEPSIWSSATGRESRGRRQHGSGRGRGRGRTVRPPSTSDPWHLSHRHGQDDQAEGQHLSGIGFPEPRGFLLGVSSERSITGKRLDGGDTPVSRWTRPLAIRPPPGPRLVRATRRLPPGPHRET